MNTQRGQEGYRAPTAREIERLVEIMKAASHPIRIEILVELLRWPCCVSDIHTRLGITQPVASQHLTILRNNRLVSFEREGTTRCYSLRNPRVVRLLLDVLEEDVKSPDPALYQH